LGREATALQARRLWIIEQLSALVRNGSVPKNDLWVVDVLDFFSLHGLFTVTKKSEKSSFSHVRTLAKPAFSQEVQEACRAKLLACVADLTASTPGRQEGREKLADDAVNKNEKREKRAPGTASDGVLWMIKVLETISTLESDGKHIQPISRVSADKDNEASFTKARETLAHLKTVSAEQRTSAQGIELLLSGILLRQYCSGGCNQNEAADNEDSLDVSYYTRHVMVRRGHLADKNTRP
jgi:DNA polymerase phi